MLVLLERITRHWFLFFIVFGGYCLLISGFVGQGLGIPYLFRDSLGLIEHAQTHSFLTLFTSGPTFLTQLSATFLIGTIWFFVGLLDHKPGREKYHATLESNLLFLAPRVFVFSLLPLLAAYLSANEKYSPFLDNEEVRAVLGTVAGYILLILYVVASHLVAKLPKLTLLQSSSILSIVSLAALALLPQLLPVVALTWMLGCFVLLYVLIVLMPEGLRPVAVVALIFWVSFSNGAPFKYRFDGIVTADGSSYYETKNLVNFHKAQSLTSANANKDLIDPVSNLESWKNRLGKRKPKLVLVTTSGGAYRAAFWTALVLDKLKQESARSGPLARLTDHVKLVTGASGGMVGAAYFVASRGPKGDDKRSIVSMIEQDIEHAQLSSHFTNVFQVGKDTPQKNVEGSTSKTTLDLIAGTTHPVARDTLSSIIQNLVQEDVRHIFLPYRQKLDRGRVLEDHWGALKTSFSDLKKGEMEGWRPSIILSPMVIETGQPMLISNLSLSTIRKTMPKPVFFILRAFPDTDPRADKERRAERNVLKQQQDALEFFRLFPGAQQQFRLGTAVRMSASFAYISPAVELPTFPAQRVVDAGYYDNYGVSMAIAYLRQRDVMQWVSENTSGVMLIQIRAFPTLVDEREQRRIRRNFYKQLRGLQGRQRNVSKDFMQKKELRNLCKLFRPTKSVNPNDKSYLEHFTDRLGRSFQWLTSPFESVEMSRQTSMLVRNNLEIELLQDLYKQRNKGKDLLQTVVFENRLSTSLNWNMPGRELDCLKLQLRSGANRKALNELAKFWRDTPY
ncbi:MAG: hypothetical protein AAF228_10625 [Pseudomonadota bacterium]